MPRPLARSLACALPALLAAQAPQATTLKTPRLRRPPQGASQPRPAAQNCRLDLVQVRQAESARPVGAAPIPVRLREAAQRQRAAEAFARPAATATYTYASLSQLSYADLVTTVTSITWDQVTDLFQYDAGAQTFYSDANRVQYLINALQSRCSAFTASDDKGIPTLVEVIRSGYYLSYYNSAMPDMNTRAYKDKCLPAILAAQANPAFRLGNATQNGVIQAMGKLISNADSSPAVINGFTPILQDYNTNWTLYGTDSSKGSAVWNVIDAIDYDLTWNVLGGGTYSASAAGAFGGAIDGYLAQVTAFATNHAYNDPNNNWLVDSAVYLAGYDGRFNSNGNAGLQAVTSAVQKYGSAPWIFPSAQGAEVINDLYNNVDANGKAQDWTGIQNAIKAQYTPVKRDFDSGLFHTQVGASVDPTKVKTLVWAHKETRAQFFRALRVDTPVDPSHHQDDSLTMVIYNSPDEYKMNRFAYGLSTDNGGITIESLGTFFTYERTPEESYYSLEELFRHEGVHYLQGRYEEPGFFGDSPLYDNDRLTWIDEGSAEFFAGSTRNAGMKTRIIKAQLIQSYDPSTWYNVGQVTTAAYASGWTFYDYACEFVDYLYNHQWDNYMSMLDLLHAGNGTGFSALCAQDSASSSMNAGYQSWLQYVAANANSFPSPSTSPDYLAAIPAKTLASVSSDITATAGLTGVTTTTTTGLDWNTYTLRGTYAAGKSKGTLLADWQAMDALANTWLNTLTAKSWSGYKTDTCYFVNYAKDASGNVTWQVVFHGVNTDGGSPVNTVTASITTPSGNVTLNSGASQSFVGSATDSSTSATLSYAWNFGDGSSATGASASHVFTNTGSSALTRTVTFTATDNTGVSSSATRTVTVNPAAKNTVTASITTPSSNVTLNSGASQAFAGSATDSSSSATLSYAWNFGDGATATGASASHVFTNTGSSAVTRTVTFTATDNTGATSSATRTVTVNPAAKNTVTASITTPSGNVTVNSGASQAFAGSATDSSSSATLSYAWNFGDGATATGTSASHTFTNSGSSAVTRTVTFTATDNSGATSSATRTVTVNPASGAPTLNLQVSTAPGTATFSPNASASVTQVVYWVDSGSAITVNTAPFSLVYDTSALAAGSSHQVYARAVAASGAYTDSGWVSFTVVAKGLSISVAATPASGGKASFTPSISGAPAKVIYYIDNWNVAATATKAPWTASVTGLSSGLHYVGAEVLDAAGNSAYSSWVGFTVP